MASELFLLGKDPVTWLKLDQVLKEGYHGKYAFFVEFSFF